MVGQALVKVNVEIPAALARVVSPNLDIDGWAQSADPHGMPLAELADFVTRHRPLRPAHGRRHGARSQRLPADGRLLLWRRVPAVGDAGGGGEGIGDVALGDLDELRSAWCDVLLCWVSSRMLSSEPLPRHESTIAASIPGSQSHSRVEK
jgi:hypothetical protein